MGMSRTSWSPGGESGGDSAYQEAPTLAVIYNAELQRMLPASHSRRCGH